MPLIDKHRKILLQTAHDSIEHGLEKGGPLAVNPEDYAPELREIRASFVTLEIHGNLRGCIGSLTATQALVKDVAYHAHAAAFSDPRFPSLQRSEQPLLSMHISILSVPEPMLFESEQDLLRQLRPDTDGLILADRGHRGTFLPSVWSSLPKPADFLCQLKRKAGLPPDYWSDTLEIQRYVTESFE
ncbi:MAG: AmmeMemoRadiSam system protein A [Gammaproteobacteria bacterium]|nr:AmmeMemoRadiSam system protein A [Gammaproteobacteria bacterium]